MTVQRSAFGPGPFALGQKRVAFYTDDPGEGGVAIYVNTMLCALVARPDFRQAVVNHLSAAGVLRSVNLVPGRVRRRSRCWLDR